ncbi:MAG: diadenylate cyclase CdaA [Anaerolineales bacterium]|nr:diadenylate cyclase CdaA [Anaerolineales bacterium]
MLLNIFENFLFILQRFNWWSVLDVFLVSMIFFFIFRFLQETKAMVLLRGVLILILVVSILTISSQILPAFSWLLNTTLPALLFAIPVIFTPEIRRVLERLGRTGINSLKEREAQKPRDLISSIIYAVTRLSSRRHGALIVMQRMDMLNEYASTGVTLNAELTPEILLQIFYPNTPLHDGAVIIENDRIKAAACVMPLSSSGVLTDAPERKMGLRHRAGLGISEISDAIIIIVSEETGSITLAYNGRMVLNLTSERLDAILRTFFVDDADQKGFFQTLFREINKKENDGLTIKR